MVDMPVYAESVNYWKTGSSSTDTWMERIKDEIEEVGGVVISDGIVTHEGRAMALLSFKLGGLPYRINWPVLELDPRKKRSEAQRKTDKRSALVQAVTMLYHDVKARTMVCKIMGVDAAFQQYRLMPNGTTVAEQGFKGEKIELPTGLLLSGGE